MDQKEIERIRYEMRYGKPHGVSMDVSIRLDLEEMRGWNPENVAAFMGGIARVIAVENEARQIGVDHE